MEDRKVIEYINKSGYILQVAIENEINKITPTHDWTVLDHEVAWKNNEALSYGYVDLIAARGIGRLVIECKRVESDTDWIFLNLVKEPKHNDYESAISMEATLNTKGQIFLKWGKFSINPVSKKSEYCVIPSKERLLLEKTIGELIDATEAISLKEINAFSHDIQRNLFYIPVIVTNANLKTCKILPSECNLHDGKLIENTNEIETVPMIRFEKSIKTNDDSNILCNKGIITTFIINSAHLIRILKNWTVERWNEWKF